MMPTVIPNAAAPSRDQRRALRMGLLLGGLLSVPVIALLALEGALAVRCSSKVEASGVLIGKTLWRIERKDCVGAKVPFYDVMIGVEGKASASALTGRGEPRPVSVEVSGADSAKIALSGPLDDDARSSFVNVKLRGSGTPMERVDLETLASTKPNGGHP